MNTQASLPSDLIDLLSEFENTAVEYLLVGGQAVALHGFGRTGIAPELGSAHNA